MSNAKILISLLFPGLLVLSAAARAGAIELGAQKTGAAAPCADTADSCSAFPAAQKKPVLDFKSLSRPLPAPETVKEIKLSSPAVRAAAPAVKNPPETAPAKPLPAAPPAPQECAPCEILFWKKVVAAAVLAGLALAAWKLYSLRKK